MNAQFNIQPLNKEQLDTIVDLFTTNGLAVEANYLAKNKAILEWNENVQGIEIKMDNKAVFTANKDSAILVLKRIPKEKQQAILAYFQNNPIVKKTEYGLGIGLTAVYTLLFLAVCAARYQTGDEGIAIVVLMFVGSCLLGLLLICTAEFKIAGNIQNTIGLIIFFIGAIGTAPGSLLTLALFKAGLRKDISTS